MYPQPPYPQTPEDRTTARVAPRAPRSTRTLPSTRPSPVPEEERNSPSLVTIEEVLASRAESSTSRAPRSPKGNSSRNRLSDESSDDEEFQTPIIETRPTEQVPQRQTQTPQATRMSIPTTISNIKVQLTPGAVLELQNDKLPSIHKKAPPEFNGDKPENLLAWLAACEALFALNKITEDTAKKFLAVSWMSYATQLEWKDNPIVTSATTTWEDFQQMLKKGYPETASEEIGSKQRIEKLVKSVGTIYRNELQKIQKFIRAFSIEANKLMSGPQPVLSNNEAVRWFLTAFDGSFVNTILDKAEVDPKNKVDRREDDPFTLKEIIESAEKQARLWKGYSTSLISTSEPAVAAMVYNPDVVTGNAKVKGEPDDEWGRKVSLSKDRHDVEIKHHDQKLSAIEQSLAALKNSVESIARGAPSSSRAPSYPQQSSSSSYLPRPTSKPSSFTPAKSTAIGDMMCYFCREKGHGVRTCPSIEDLKSKGILVMKDGTNQMMLKDGGYMPRDDDEMSRKDKVLQIARQRGWMVEDQSSYFFEEPDNPLPEEVFYQEPAEGSQGVNLDAFSKHLFNFFLNKSESEENDKMIGKDAADAWSKNY